MYKTLYLAYRRHTQKFECDLITQSEAHYHAMDELKKDLERQINIETVSKTTHLQQQIYNLETENEKLRDLLQNYDKRLYVSNLYNYLNILNNIYFKIFYILFYRVCNAVVVYRLMNIENFATFVYSHQFLTLF